MKPDPQLFNGDLSKEHIQTVELKRPPQKKPAITAPGRWLINLAAAVLFR